VEIFGSLGGHEVHDNYIHDAWDGVDILASKKGADSNVDIHHNRIENLIDDGAETGGSEEGCRFHDSIYIGCDVGVRIKAPHEGPLYIYGNMFFDNKEDIRNFGQEATKKGGIPLDPAAVYVYNNTTTAGPARVNLKVYGIGTPNYHYYDNLSWCTHWLQSSPHDDPSDDPNWKGDYNVFVRRGEEPKWEPSKAESLRLGLNLHSVWIEGDPGFTNVAARDVSLKPGSPARGAGVDLSRFFAKPLPGCEPGYFSGKAPDCGALSYGTPMPRLPRDPATLKEPAAGMWPGPEADPKKTTAKSST
jgi:hypothetical protein